MSFMRPETVEGTFAELKDGTLVPTEHLDAKGHRKVVAFKVGWFSRFSAPGFLATDWSGPHDTEREALEELAQTYDTCLHCWEQCWLTDNPCEGPTQP